MTASPLTLQTLAHELNSLLDGAMRWLSLAEQAAGTLPPTVIAQRDQILKRHAATRQAMRQMAELLQRARGETGLAQLDVDTLRSSRTIEQEVMHVVSLLTPQCQAAGVELFYTIDPRAAELPAGVLAPVILNGLRNAIEACSSLGLSTRRVVMSIHLRSAAALQMLIEDTGIGLPASLVIGASPTADGHGVGLALCRSLIDQCGGVLELANVPYGGGAVLSVTVDPAALAVVGANAA